MDIKNIQNNTIIICENNYKKYILRDLSKNKIFLNVKIITKKEFLDDYLFKYDEKTLSYLINKYNYKVDVAKMYLDNLYYIDEAKIYKNNKLKYLVNLKNELDNEGLLIYNLDYKNYLKNFNVIVLGYPYLNPIEIDIFKNINAKIIKEEGNFNIDKVYEFETHEDEINFVCKEICKLIDNGIDINKIKIAGITKSYYNDLERIFNMYNIPIKIVDGNNLYGNIIVQKFLNNYDNNLNNSIENIKNEDSEIVKKIINICNKYSFENDKFKVKSLIIEDFKNTKIDNFKLKNYIELVELNNPFAIDEYVFLMNFSVGNIPNNIKDEDYITDNIKEKLNLDKTNKINKIYKEFIKNKLNNIKNLIITYKKKGNNEECFISSLQKEMNLKVVQNEHDILESYSMINDKINYARLEDDLNKYGNVKKEYYVYKNSLGNINYNSFDNKFKGINKDNFKDYLNDKLTLSYSSLNNFNKCAFRFYISNILKLDKYEEKFEAFIGSVFHHVLEKCFNNNLNVEEEVNNYIKMSGKTLTIKERFFINKIIEDIKFAVNVLRRQKEYISLDKVMYEKNICIDKSKDINIEFTGFIDKVLYSENKDNTLISIIDYKTGNIDIDLKYLPYGLGLQLPIYLYLVKKSNLFNNPKFLGFYLQYILDKDIKRDITKNYEEEKYNNLKLMGYTNNNIHEIVNFDNSYSDSKLIKGLKTKANGDFYSTSKVLSDNEIDKIIELTERNIDDGISKILDGDFSINPKKIGYDKDLGCEYCKFKDICFRKEEDYIILDDIKTLDFLGGDDNA